MMEPLKKAEALKTAALRKRRHLVITLLLCGGIAVLIAILGKGLTLDSGSTGSALVGKHAQAFSVRWLQGRELLPEAKSEALSLGDLQGKPLILNFWASWCMSCREEAALLESFWRKHKESDLNMVGLALQDSPEAAAAFASEYGKTYMLGLDPDGKVAIDYGVTGVPETFFIDRQGVVRHKVSGPLSLELLNKWLAEIQ